MYTDKQKDFINNFKNETDLDFIVKQKDKSYYCEIYNKGKQVKTLCFSNTCDTTFDVYKSLRELYNKGVLL